MTNGFTPPIPGEDNTEPITEEPKNYDWLYIIVGIILFYIIVIRGGKL